MKFKLKPFYCNANQYTRLIKDEEDLKKIFEWYKPDELLNFKKKVGDNLENRDNIPTFGANSEFTGERLISYLTDNE